MLQVWLAAGERARRAALAVRWTNVTEPARFRAACRDLL